MKIIQGNFDGVGKYITTRLFLLRQCGQFVGQVRGVCLRSMGT